MVEQQSPSPAADTAADPIVSFFLEDFAVTALLRQGRALKTAELTAASEGLSLARGALHTALDSSTRLVQNEREWDLAIRASRKELSREERDRQPLEAAVAELMVAIGKPLPLPVIARELSFLRGTFVSNLKELTAGILRSARWAVETTKDTYLHESFLLDAHAPTQELVVSHNGLDRDPALEELSTLELPAGGGGLAEDVLGVLRAADYPLTHKQLGFLLYRQNPTGFDPLAAARAISDRTRFYSFTGGFVAPMEQLTALRNYVHAWAQEHSGNAAGNIDVAALLRRRNGSSAATARELPVDVMEDLKTMSRRSAGQPVSLAVVMTELLEIDPKAAEFVPTLHALNDRLRSDPEFLPIGIGKFLLREIVPTHIGEVPEELRPVQVSVRDPETDEPRDFEMGDDGLEGDAPDFIHDPQWDDLGEEAEVKMTRRAGGSDSQNSVRYVILNHHHRAGTLKIRRIDEEFFGVQGPLTRLGITTETGNLLEGWISRDSGLMYSLGDWFKPQTPPSGGVLVFAHDGSNYRVKIDTSDKLTHLEGHRAEELVTMREAARYMSLFELLQNIMREHGGGMELPTLWAEVNIVRRTSKRLMCSVLSGYHCFYFKQRGPKQILWRFDAGKLDQGFKRNKRKYVRR